MIVIVGILQTVLAAKDQIDRSSNLLNTSGAISNILGDIILTFRLFGFSTAPWFEDFMKPIVEQAEPQITQMYIEKNLRKYVPICGAQK